VKRLKSPVGLAILIVLLLSIGGAAAAGTGLITGKEIKDHSITGREIKRKSIPISALRTIPSSQGERGERGDPGESGLSGEPGEKGQSALTEAFPFEGSIPSTVAPSTEWEFLGSETVTVFGGDRGQITATVAIGTNDASIDDPAKFELGICFDEGEGEGVTPFTESEQGVSPELISGQRVAVTLATSFGLTGEPDEGVEADLGPCVLNETTSDLDDNDRYEVAILLAAA